MVCMQLHEGDEVTAIILVCAFANMLVALKYSACSPFDCGLWLCRSESCVRVFLAILLRWCYLHLNFATTMVYYRSIRITVSTQRPECEQ
ncbi:hypothetical protein T440DRAFT_470145 [Plenodomus tracheiphilus IPT5]|uniref:Uncharacterized protein n=1 Tax=Plenodomus tracheiphilus IPT5 TaxID=1408161 RepID=A0A6A7AZ18_9PLEO|nr:hypothetical protein T440DRAFT_470145 [Plenodomus tracheiphilus IPT5]